MSPRRVSLANLVLIVCLAVPVGCGGLEDRDVAQQDQGTAEISEQCLTDEDCDNGNPCQSGSCGSDGQCIYIPVAGVPCNDDSACTQLDTCNEDGVCTGEESLMCSDSNDCTIDTCDSELGCVFVPLADGSICEDGSKCSVGDQCLGGECVEGTIVDCQDNEQEDCFYPTCDSFSGECDRIEQHPTGHPCKDGDPCTDDDSCDQSGECQPGSPHDCTPQNPCKKAWCNETAKEGTNPCVLEWKVSGVGCDDGDACSESDICQPVDDGPVLSCQGAIIDCDDSDPCTADSCDSDIGCVFAPKTDGTPCSENPYWKCIEGTCICMPNCIDKECGTDGCQGTCGECDVSASCVDGQCLCPYEKCNGLCCDFGQVCTGGGCCTTDCAGKECGPDGCGGACGQCPGQQYDCQIGKCVCVPSCVGKQCGDDGCGGNCGQCADPLANCVQGGCQCPHEECGEICCVDGQSCFGEECCTPQCAAKNCGDDGCGGTCGSCPGPQYECQLGVCVCIPSCVGKECGGDGCGGSCGNCEPTEKCSVGTCSCQYEDCGNGCCLSGQSCYLGSCCSPSCSGKQCGPDGCGGSCGQCQGAQYQCNNGKCVCIPTCSGKECGSDGCAGQCGNCGQYEHCSGGDCLCDNAECGVKCCGPGQTCSGGQCCTPSCGGKNCGSDGCGGSCGTCGAGSTCQNGQCICTPQCGGKNCGSDGCGGSCGSCQAGWSCSDGQCGLAGITWVTIPGGTYMMGCEKGQGVTCFDDESPAHSVTLATFQLMQTEVTEGQYMAVMGENPSYDECGASCPVEGVSWFQAKWLCEALGGRLPTEAEWEYAARAGTSTQYSCGNNDPCLNGIAWYYVNSGNKKHPVKTKAPNGFGLYDTTGNVEEWVADWYDKDYYSVSPSQNPKGPSSGSNHVRRGGAFFDYNGPFVPTPYNYRVWRRRYEPKSGSVGGVCNVTGFRCAK